MSCRKIQTRLIVFFLIVFSVCMLSCGSLQSPELRVHRNFTETLYEKRFLIRRAVPDGHLLLKILNEDIVFLYDTKKKTVTSVGMEVWHGSAEKVSICDGSRSIDGDSQTKFGTDAKYAISYAASPTDSKLAIYSANGPKVSGISLIPGMGGGTNYWGAKYLEIRNNDSEKKAILDPVVVEDYLPSPSLCWTQDEKIVLLFNPHWFYFSVLDLDPQNHDERLPTAANAAQFPPDLSRLTGTLKDQGVDEDGDGLFEAIKVEIETETTMPGGYRFFVALSPENGPNDKRFTVVSDVQLKGGREVTELRFDTSEMFDTGVEGKFVYSVIDLGYGMLGLEQKADSAKTSAYKLSQFKRPNIVYTGENKVTPVRPDKNGKFRALEILIGVDVLYPGEYKFQGDLYHERSTVTAEGLIEFGFGNTTLKRGKNNVKMVFSGKKIVDYGLRGKFRVRNFYMYKTGQKAEELIENLLVTREFDPNEFVPE